MNSIYAQVPAEQSALLREFRASHPYTELEVEGVPWRYLACGQGEQALLFRLKGKGLVVFTGCGHPTIEVILEMVDRLSNEPLYAVGGGLHFPVTGGRGNRAGIQFQTMIGTGKPPWQRITDEDLSRTIAAINSARPRRVYLSGHDTCDHALDRMMRELDAETEVLEAGATYLL